VACSPLRVFEMTSISNLRKRLPGFQWFLDIFWLWLWVLRIGFPPSRAGKLRGNARKSAHFVLHCILIQLLRFCPSFLVSKVSIACTLVNRLGENGHSFQVPIMEVFKLGSFQKDTIYLNLNNPFTMCQSYHRHPTSMPMSRRLSFRSEVRRLGLLLVPKILSHGSISPSSMSRLVQGIRSEVPRAYLKYSICGPRFGRRLHQSYTDSDARENSGRDSVTIWHHRDRRGERLFYLRVIFILLMMIQKLIDNQRICI
jgi:hypothetical protein